MKARDLTPACIGRVVKIESETVKAQGVLHMIHALRPVFDNDKPRLSVIVGGNHLRLDGTETVSITG